MTELLFKDVDFIRAAYMDTSLCDRIIKFFEDSPHLHSPGRCGGAEVIEEVKKSTDFDIIQTPYHTEYFYELQKILELYIEEYPYCNSLSPFIIKEGTNIQRYLPSEGFYGWHCERDGVTPLVQDRHLVFMTYLNDVDDDGETEFLYQKLKIKPQKGLTVIWPADWTFTHRGITSPTQTKYIVTGWFNFISQEEYNERTHINESR